MKLMKFWAKFLIQKPIELIKFCSLVTMTKNVYLKIDTVGTTFLKIYLLFMRKII